MNTTYPKIKSMSPQIVVADLEMSLNFYNQKLGFTVDFRYEDFSAGKSVMAVRSILNLADPLWNKD